MNLSVWNLLRELLLGILAFAKFLFGYTAQSAKVSKGDVGLIEKVFDDKAPVEIINDTVTDTTPPLSEVHLVKTGKKKAHNAKKGKAKKASNTAAKSAETLLFQLHDRRCVELDMNNAIANSQFGAFYDLLLSSVIVAKGPKTGLNWRWLDLNLLLSELKLHEFGSVDWYNDTDENKSKRTPSSISRLLIKQRKTLDQAHIQAAFVALPAAEKVDVLRRSAIEPLDATLANTTNDGAMRAEAQGKDTIAAEKYETALGLDPHCLAALYNYADFLARREKYEKAEQLLNKLLLLSPYNAMSWGLRAMVAESTGSISSATDYYEQAYRIDKTSSTRLRNFAMLMVQIKAYSRAKTLYEELIKLNRRDGIIIGEYADLLHSMNLKTEAAAAFERAFSTGNCNSTVVNDYAVLLRTMAQENNDPSLLVRAREIFQLIPQPNAYERMNQKYF